jgi:hypothetical protein
MIVLSHAQTGHGLSFDNYNTIYAITTNPAFSVESKSKWQINGFSYNNLNFTDVGEIDPLDLNYLSTPSGFNGISYDTNFEASSTTNTAFSERDWLLPSVIYKLSDKIAIGLAWRSRVITNYSDFNGGFFEVVNQGEETQSTPENYPSTRQNFTNTSHHWGELGVNFAVSIINTDNHVIKLGGTVKWLRGQGVINIKGENFETSLTNNNQLEIRSGSTLTYLNTFENTENQGSDIISTDITSNIFGGPFQNFFSNKLSNNNFGGDAGLVWEIRTKATNRLDRGLSESSVNLYKIKISGSLLDLGLITYDKDPNGNKANVLNDLLNVENNLSTTLQNFNTRGALINILRQNIGTNVNREQQRGEVKVALPTSLNLNIDYLLSNAKNLYLNLNYTHPIRENTDDFANQRMQLITLTPRIEHPNWSIYAPISYGAETDLGFGLGGRYKFITAGVALNQFINQGGFNYVYIGINQSLIKL